MKAFAAAFAVALLAGCASAHYHPLPERPLAQIATLGCGEPGSRVLVTAQVSKAYEDTVVLWDGVDPQRALAVTVPKSNLRERVGGWFGASKQEVMRDELNHLAAQHLPVTAMLECKDRGGAPELVNITFVNSKGQRSVIAPALGLQSDDTPCTRKSRPP
jgi:hypothetical protein